MAGSMYRSERDGASTTRLIEDRLEEQLGRDFAPASREALATDAPAHVDADGRAAQRVLDSAPRELDHPWLPRDDCPEEKVVEGDLATLRLSNRARERAEGRRVAPLVEVVPVDELAHELVDLDPPHALFESGATCRANAAASRTRWIPGHAANLLLLRTTEAAAWGGVHEGGCCSTPLTHAARSP